MYVSRIVVRHFRNFRFLDLSLTPNVTCIVGENNTGKTNLVHAIRLAIDARLSSYRRRLTLDDFPAGTDIREPQQVLISLEIRDFADKPNQEAMVYGYHVNEEVARITYRFRPRRAIRDAIANEDHPGTGLTLEDYQWDLSGGGDDDLQTVAWNQDCGTTVKTEELHQSFLVVLMEPLRDVEQRLRQHRSSPLTQLLSPADIPNEEQEALVAILAGANEQISASATISSVGQEISSAVANASGTAFALDVRLGMAPPSFDDVSRALTVLLSNHAMRDFDPSKNGLGSNNILFISMLLKHFERRIRDSKTAGQLLIVEEPEAHLHPQLQRVLFNSLRKESFQTIVTTHSTHISSQAPLESIVVLTNDGSTETVATVPAKDLPLADNEVHDLERYLDATRATLFFARRVLLVEGPAEAFLIPELIRHVLGISLDEHGISVIPIYGVHFAAYVKLFGSGGLPKRCAIVADGDLEPSDSSAVEDSDDLPPVHRPDLTALEGEFVRVFACETTFERAVTIHGTLRMLAAAANELGAPRIAAFLTEVYEEEPPNHARITECGTRVLNTAKRVGKARFAQIASKHAALASSLPPYVRQAVDWLKAE